MKRGRIIEARDFMTALREAREAGATAIQPPLSCEVRPLDEYIAELESDGEGPGEACYVRFGRYIVNARQEWQDDAEVYVLYRL